MIRGKLIKWLFTSRWRASALAFALAFVSLTSSRAQHIPFGFWVYKAPATVVTISSSVTITDANYTTYQNNAITINTGVVVTMQTSKALAWKSLTMTGTAQIVEAPCTSSVCYPIVLSIGSDLTIPSTGSITADGAGYLGGNGSNGYTTGFVISGTGYTGGSHAGYGGSASGSPAEVYDNLLQPTDMGGGGGSSGSGYSGGNGGGAIKLTVSGTLTINGLISANGATGTFTGSYWQGSGAGGSIWITANQIASSVSTPVILANGNGTSNTSYANAGGGGGRVALYYSSLSSFNIPTMTQANGGVGNSSTYNGGSGTIYSYNQSSSKGALLMDNATRVGNYNSGYTNLRLPANSSFDAVTVQNSAYLKQESATYSFAINVLTIQTSGRVETPTNGAAGYGPWFSYSSLVGGPAPAEY